MSNEHGEVAESEAPGAATQPRPCRPRPWVWCSATIRQGEVSSLRRPRGPGASPARARASSSVLVDSIRAITSTDRPGSSGESCIHRSCAPQAG